MSGSHTSEAARHHHDDDRRLQLVSTAEQDLRAQLARAMPSVSVALTIGPPYRHAGRRGPSGSER